METQMTMILILAVAQTLGDKIEKMKTSGLIEFQQDTWSIKKRNWTIYPPQNRTNVALLIEMIDYREYAYYYTRTLHFPDGTSNTVPTNKYLDNPFCRVYVKGAETGQVTCEVGVQIGNVCKEPSVVAQMWPPTISAELLKFSMLMYYEFVDCRENEVNSTTFPTTTKGMESLSKATETNQATSSATITETHEWNESYKSSAHPSVATSCESLHYTVIALSVLLVIVLVLLAIAAWKNRKLSRNTSTNTEDMSMNNYNHVTEHVTFAQVSGTKPDVRSIHAMAEESDGNVPDEKQTVDNELYQIPEKQDEINELYDCTS